MKPKIKFNHKYSKLNAVVGIDTTPRLLQVLRVHYKKLSEEFINYDTMYVEDGMTYFYQDIPNSFLLLLIFQGEETRSIFTTLRKWTREKEKYYRSLIGKEVEIVIMEEEK